MSTPTLLLIGFIVLATTIYTVNGFSSISSRAAVGQHIYSTSSSCCVQQSKYVKSTICNHIPQPQRRQGTIMLQSSSLSDDLLTLVNDNSVEEDHRDQIKSTIFSLEDSFRTSSTNTTASDNVSRFQPLLGLYEVQSVITSNPKDNPVGGKWTRANSLMQKLFRTRSTFQHLVQFNSTGLSSTYVEAVAEAINIISLDALDGLLRATVILRGDAVPLSIEQRDEMNMNRTSSTPSSSLLTPLTNLVVRAYFDAPRIYFGKRRGRRGSSSYSYLPLQIGPRSSVVLDTTYCDEQVRIGMGGTSGSRFVFTATDSLEAKEYTSLLKLPYVKKWKLLAQLGFCLAVSLWYIFGSNAVGDMIRDNLISPLSLKAGIKFSRRMTRRMKSLAPLAAIMSSYPVVMKILASLTSVLSGIGLLLISFSSGGIERRRGQRMEDYESDLRAHQEYAAE